MSIEPNATALPVSLDHARLAACRAITAREDARERDPEYARADSASDAEGG